MSINHRKSEELPEIKSTPPLDSQNGQTNNQHTIVPSPQPRPENVITPRQERALRYLERKRVRQERLSQQLPVVKPPAIN